MKTVTRFLAALFIAASFSVVSTGCTAGSLTGPQETVQQPVDTPADTNNGDLKNTDPGGNDHNVSNT